jgi:hypothetical protein
MIKRTGKSGGWWRASGDPYILDHGGLALRLIVLPQVRNRTERTDRFLEDRRGTARHEEGFIMTYTQHIHTLLAYLTTSSFVEATMSSWLSNL